MKQQEFLTDIEIVEKVKRGDKEAFSLLVERYQKGLINLLFPLIRNYEEALELCQEVFLKVYSHLEQYDKNYKFSTWIYRIANNLAIDHLRKGTPKIDSIDEKDEDEESKIEIESKDLSPQERLEKKFMEKEILIAISSLDTVSRELIILRHIHFRSYEEMAKITNLPVGTVKNKIFRARKELMKKLEKVK